MPNRFSGFQLDAPLPQPGTRGHVAHLLDLYNEARLAPQVKTIYSLKMDKVKVQEDC